MTTTLTTLPGFKTIENASRSDISAVAFTPDGHIFGGDTRGDIRRWRVKDGQQVGPTMKASGSIESAVVSNDGRWLVTGDDGRKGIVWNAHTHEKALEVTEHARFVYAVDVSSDSARFATGSSDRTVRVFDLATGVRLVAPFYHDRAVVGLKFFPQGGDKVVTATYDTCVRVYDSLTGDKLLEVPVRVMHTPTTPFAWSRDGKELFVVSPGKITCIDTSTFSSSEWFVHDDSSRASIVTDGRFIACSAGTSISLWDATLHEQIGQVIKHFLDILCIAFSPQENLIACGHGNKILFHGLEEIIECDTLFPTNVDETSNSATENSACSAATTHGPTSLPDLVKRSEDREKMRSLEDALEHANLRIRTDASCHHAYERKYIALHGMGRYDEAIEAFDAMLSLIEQSGDPKIRQLRDKYVSTFRKRKAIEEVVGKVFKHGPLVLIDVTTGRLCDRKALPDLFKSDSTFKELISSVTEEIDNERIWKVVNSYFGYVMLSHVWGNGKEEERRNEPSLEVVKHSKSVYSLPDTPMNNKLRRFCAKVTELGYRWAWSDTCCIDRSYAAILGRSVRSMYKWYNASHATLVFLGDVSSDLGDLLHSIWMTRSWTLQEALVPKRILFYDRDWKFYRGIASDNHKKPGVILQELSDATGVPSETLASFHPDSLGVREKLRLASTRSATIEEDAAYSLIGLFKSDIIPQYGEGEDALGHLLEGIVAHLGEVTVLAWTGTPSSYNSCLPSTLAVYSQTPYAPPPILDAADMQSRTTELSRTALSREDAIDIYRRIVRLPPARFVKRRLQLPCIVFLVKSLSVEERDDRGPGHGGARSYHARAFRLGTVVFVTEAELPLAEPRRLVVVHPWIGDIRGPHHHHHHHVEAGVDVSDSETEVGRNRESDGESGAAPQVDEYALALRMIVRLQQPFAALLLLRQSGGEYKRVAADSRIIVQISRNRVRSKDVHTEVLDVL